jgi:hypothetical protein
VNLSEPARSRRGLRARWASADCSADLVIMHVAAAARMHRHPGQS